MKPDYRQQVEDLFNRARNLPPSERAAFLERSCGVDRALRLDVESRLAREAAAWPTMGGAAAAPARAPAPEPGQDLVGRTLSHYRVVEKIGEGGMGVVFRGWDEHLRRD